MLGYFVGFEFTGDALFEIDRFRRPEGENQVAHCPRDSRSRNPGSDEVKHDLVSHELLLVNARDVGFQSELVISKCGLRAVRHECDEEVT